jgi:DNA-binding transcriptional ArsR family regulator
MIEQDMGYRAEVDWAPAHELLTSISAYARAKEAKTLELGEQWVKALRQRTGFERAAWENLTCSGWLSLLVWLCPARREAADFVDWLGRQSAGALYELLAPFTTTAHEHNALPADLGAWRDAHVQVLAAWDRAYFRDVDRAILRGLQASAAATRALLETRPTAEVVETATCGLHYIPPPEVTTVLLVPQYHYRPWNLYDRFGAVKLLMYPADAVAPAAGDVPPGLLRLTRALGDESRLRILRFLAGGQRSFTEVVREAGLAKSTVHYHMVALRAAGLVRVHDADDGVISYSLRPQVITALSENLRAYVQPDAETDSARASRETDKEERTHVQQ